MAFFALLFCDVSGRFCAKVEDYRAEGTKKSRDRKEPIAAMCGLSVELLLDFDFAVGFDGVAFLAVVASLEGDTALEVGGDFLDVVFETLEAAMSPEKTTTPSRMRRALSERETLPSMT